MDTESLGWGKEMKSEVCERLSELQEAKINLTSVS